MDEQRNETQELAVAPKTEENAITYAKGQTIWNNLEMYAMAVKQAKILASSDLVPEGTYRGKPQNCLIALDMSNRTGLSPLNVMQNLYIVKGKPGWSGQYCVGAINSCGKFTPLEFVQMVDDNGKTTGYYAQSINRETGKICVGPPVTWDMVRAEGWYDKNGSKWKTMPDLMFRYRCAAFFARVYCPEVLNGLQTVEELKDVRGYDEPGARTTVITLDE